MLKKTLFYLFLILLSSYSKLAISDPAEPSSSKELSVTSVTPSGEDVEATRQIVIQFNRPVVPLGRMDRKPEEIPIVITPTLSCEWRWLNTSALACQLKEKTALKKSTQYTLSIQPGIKAQDGATLAAPYVHSFTTLRPQVTYVNTVEWQSPVKPLLRLYFNQAVTKDSVEQAVYLSYEDPKSQQVKTMGLLVEQEKKAEEKPPSNAQEKAPSSAAQGLSKTWLILPKDKLPLDTRVGIKVRPGLKALEGPALGGQEEEVEYFATFPEFKFLGVTCLTNKNYEIKITPEIGITHDQKCNPLGYTRLVFSSPVLTSQVRDQLIITPDLAGGRKDYNPWAGRKDYTGLKRSRYGGEEYGISLPETLKAAQAYHFKSQELDLGVWKTIKSWFAEVPQVDLVDEFGRHLKEPIDFSFLTDHRNPNFELEPRTAVLEAGVGSELPLYVTNLEEVKLKYRRLQKTGQTLGQELSLSIPPVKDIQFAVPLKVREMLQGGEGLVYGTLSTIPPVKKYASAYQFFAQVTPFQVHAKIGYFNSLIWVTDLATGKPIPGAKVTLYEDALSELSEPIKILQKTSTDETGRAFLKGSVQLDPQLNILSWRCPKGLRGDECPRLFVRVDQGEHFAVLPLTSSFEIYPHEISSDVYGYNQKQYSHIHTWGTTAQGVYRAGGKIQYKLYVRNQNQNTYVPAPQAGYTLTIKDPTGKVVEEIKDLTLSEFGSYSGEYLIPKNAVVGWYTFVLKASFREKYQWVPLQVLVSDFNPSPFKVSTNLNGKLFQPGETLKISSQAQLHSGGAYTQAEARVVVRLNHKIFSSDHPFAKGFSFDTYKDFSSKRLLEIIGELNDQGEYEASLNLPKEDIVYGSLSAETSVRDDRGKYVAGRANANYVAVDRLVGLKNSAWLYQEGEEANIKYLVVDEKGVPASGSKVALKIERLESKAAKVKSAGSAYVTKYVDEWTASGTCEGVSASEALDCSFIPSQPGTYKITATTLDTQGRQHQTEIRAWVAGKGRVLWHTKKEHALEIQAEKASYGIGETARYLIKNPFPGAKALISIERYGIIKSWVQSFDTSTPVLEFEVEKDFMPGFYLSVILLSPRVEAPVPPVGQVDLGKPTFRMAYLKVSVNDPYKQLDVKVQSDKQVYKPGDWVEATAFVKPKHQDKDEPIEVAVTVLDEAVLDLLKEGKNYFDPYLGFFKLDALDLTNFSLLKRLVGRQEFEKKGANPGGGGGTNISMRSLFKYVSYWNPSLKPDESGKVSFKFQVPDNLTGWRILALAVTPTDRMGLGDHNFKVNLSTEIRPVLPNQVSEEDRFKAGFSVMNRTDGARKIEVSITAQGDLKSAEPFKQSLELAPYERKTVFMPVETTRVKQGPHIKKGTIQFKVIAQDETDGDGLSVSVPVLKRRSLETAASYGSTMEKQVGESIQFPQKIYTDVGEVSVVLSPTVLGNLEGAFQYMKAYPYLCWEQKLSKAVMASHYKNLKDYLPQDFQWKESQSLIQKTLEGTANYQASNGGMGYFLAQDSRVDPYLSAYTALAFGWLKASGHSVPGVVEKNLHQYLDKLLREDAFPSHYTRSMINTVRAVALAALARENKISLSDLERFYPVLDSMSLFGRALFLQAALSTPGTEDLKKQVTQSLLASSQQSAGKLVFTESLDDGYTRILASPLRSSCTILSALVDYAKEDVGKALVGDLPFKIVRGISQSRGSRTHWENTQENLFCMQGLVDYAKVYEKEKPQMQVGVKLNQENIGQTRFAQFKDEPVTLSRPLNKAAPGTTKELKISRQGQGRLYYGTRLTYAPLKEQENRQNAGIEIRREYSVKKGHDWFVLKDPNEIKRGDLVRVDIYLSLPAARNFVVVDDPVPGALEPLNQDLATTSQADADQADYQAAQGSYWFNLNDWIGFEASFWSFYHQEIRHDAVRFYSDYLPAGNYHLSYLAQAIAEGEFSQMPVHAEEMYDPDVYGKGLPGRLRVSGN